MTAKANRSIRGILYPTLVASCVLAYTATEEQSQDIFVFKERMVELLSSIRSSTGTRLVSLIQRFPELGNPPLLARLARHVAG